VPLGGVIDSLGYRPVVPGEAEKVVSNPQPVLARGVELLEQTQTFLAHRVPGQTRTRVVRIRFRWQGREAVLYNLHLHSFGTDKPWGEEDDHFSLAFWRDFLQQYRQAYFIRAEEAAQIERMVAAETLPVLIVGDFNSTPHNWAAARLLAGRQDAYKVAGRRWGATYHAGLPFVRIDYVVAGTEWEIVSARVARARSSDHLPLIVRLRWKD
jgi:hypothetical protein